MIEEKYIIVEVVLIENIPDKGHYYRLEYRRHGKEYATAGAAMQKAAEQFEIFIIQKIYKNVHKRKM